MNETMQTGRLIPYLVEMFRFQAWVALGKVTNPMSGKVERELPMAKAMIDLLCELEARTEGHRSSDETRLLQGAVTELRLNYLDEMKQPPAEEKPAVEEKPAAEETPAAQGDGAPETGDA